MKPEEFLKEFIKGKDGEEEIELNTLLEAYGKKCFEAGQKLEWANHMDNPDEPLEPIYKTFKDFLNSKE